MGNKNLPIACLLLYTSGLIIPSDYFIIFMVFPPRFII